MSAASRPPRSPIGSSIPPPSATPRRRGAPEIERFLTDREASCPGAHPERQRTRPRGVAQNEKRIPPPHGFYPRREGNS
jgi:hypothetical protein